MCCTEVFCMVSSVKNSSIAHSSIINYGNRNEWSPIRSVIMT